MFAHLIRRIFIVFTLSVSVNLTLIAQMTPERFAYNNIHKQKFEIALRQLRKALRKDSVNAVANYVFSLYFFSPKNSSFQVDSAYSYWQASVKDFGQSTIRQREKMKRFPLDSALLITLRVQIDSAAFDAATVQNTEQAYLHFLDRYSQAIQRSQALELRDEVAYLNALKRNTHQSFLEFLQKYPAAAQVAEARKRYEKLLYEAVTKDRRLKNYESFLVQYPESPHRQETEKHVFEISTASGEVAAFETFLQKYPDGLFTKKAGDILYHLLKESDARILPAFLMSDSIRHIEALEHQYLVPIFKDGKFGFMDRAGVEIMAPTALQLDNIYRCGNITDDVIALTDRVVAKNGAVIYNGHVEEIIDMGCGYIKIETGDKPVVAHVSGFLINEPGLTDAKIIGGKFLAMKAERWALFTLAGRQLTPAQWDDITAVDNVIMLRKNQKINLATIHQLALVADQQKLATKDGFDEVKQWTKNSVWVRAGDFEGVLDQYLQTIIPFDKQILLPTFFGAVATSTTGKKLFSKDGKVLGVFQQLKLNSSWLAVRQASTWRIFNPMLNKCQPGAYDSLTFAGPFVLGYAADSITVTFPGDKTVTFNNARTEFIPGKDSVSFLLYDDADKKSVYDSKGQKLFTAVFDKIQYAGQGVFIITRKDKKGLINLDGKIILQPDYDGMGSAIGNTISVLKNMKFGVFNLLQNKFIKPQYDKNLQVYSRNLLVAFKEGAYGFIEWDGKQRTKFEFEEIRPWNDSVAWVKNNFKWALLELTTQKIIVDKIKDFKLLLDTDTERIAIVHQENKYGVVSSTKGLVIPITFSDIKNVGSSLHPTYFTEKNIEEASLFVVLYYNSDGVMIRRQVYEEEDYEQIYCPDNE